MSFSFTKPRRSTVITIDACPGAPAAAGPNHSLINSPRHIPNCAASHQKHILFLLLTPPCSLPFRPFLPLSLLLSTFHLLFCPLSVTPPRFRSVTAAAHCTAGLELLTAPFPPSLSQLSQLHQISFLLRFCSAFSAAPFAPLRYPLRLHSRWH